jgi:outer membrane protein TolC
MPVDRTPQTIEYHAALIERDRRRRDVRALRMRIADEARRLVRQQERLAKSLEVAEASVEFAQKELEVAELRYQRGLSNNLDVVNAEANLLVAQTRRISTLADLAVARLSLRATLGVLDPRKDFGAVVAGS